MTPNDINIIVTLITCIGIGVYFVYKSYKAALDHNERKSIANDIEMQLAVYHNHIETLGERNKVLEKKVNDILNENAELKNINYVLSKDNTYLRDKLNAEKKW